MSSVIDPDQVVEQGGWSLINLLLAEQQQTTAVSKFAQLHADDVLPAQARFYQDLIPLSAPAAGEQYAFEVDLDACSGCKACVTACHNLNGLEENELWRSVGLLHGGSAELPVLQHVTTACHHCVEPACLEGCPVQAYEKDPVTGIVRHLDDQCFGCQYCILKCPYDVPKYSKSKGIVRKCDMCRDRLADNEAPACVQACPNRAIRITLVNQQAVLEASETNLFLPGAPEPGYTLPTTVYKSRRAMPRNMLPADYFSAAPQHAHLPLVFMLIFTQMSVGAFVIEQWLGADASVHAATLLAATRPMRVLAALLLGLIGLAAAVLHLGRPQYAFRAIIGLRTSWLSREILAFGVFAGLASLYAAIAWWDQQGWAASVELQNAAGLLAALAGVAGVICSIMIYVDTRRPFWNGTFTTVKFFGTALVLGLPVALLISVAAAAWSPRLSVDQVMQAHGAPLCGWLVVITASKLCLESFIFASLGNKQYTPLKRTATLLLGTLGRVTAARYALGILGGVLLPGWIYWVQQSWIQQTWSQQTDQQPAAAGWMLGVAAAMILMLLFLGETLERYLFFRAVVAPKMPGTPAS